VQPGRVWPEDDYALDADFHKLGVDSSKLMLMNLAGDTTSFRSVLIDSALGLQAKNTPFFHRRMKDLEAWLRALPPPEYPLPTDSTLVAQGKTIFVSKCADCHAPGQPNRMGTTIPLDEVGTDPERTNAWTREAANAANQKVREIGVERTPMSKPDRAGYTALQLDGLWLRGPYLHNGSIPTVAALLERAACRPKVFYRGYDVLDREALGFVAQRCDVQPASVPEGCSTILAQRCMPADKGWRYDTGERGNGNAGHEYGTDLGADDKRALIEYLKTL
jgi:hypothetical protein